MTLCDIRERSFTQKHRECVRVVNGDIGKMIRTTGTVVPAPSVSAPPDPAPPVPAPPDPAPPVPAPPDTSDALHSWFQVGHRHKVHVTDTLKGYCEFKDNLGIICRIVKAPHFLVCVRLDDFVLRTTVQRVNVLPENRARFPFLRKDEDDLVVFKVDQLERYMTYAEAQAQQAAQINTHLGKRTVARQTTVLDTTQRFDCSFEFEFDHCGSRALSLPPTFPAPRVPVIAAH